ncbi:MAG TPA: hypothetical protein VK518_22200 [Puia sp.]|nr:hypothetical protein [Puia sp.]
MGIFGNKVTVDYNNGKYYNAGTNTEYTGKLRIYQRGLLRDLTVLWNNGATSTMMNGLVNNTQVIQIKNGGSAENGGAQFEAATAAANPGQPLIVNYSVGKSYNSSEVNQGQAKTPIPGFVALAHELGHVEDWLTSLGLPLREFFSADRSKGITEGQILLPGTRTNANIPVTY